MSRIYINPTYRTPDAADGGIRRVVEAQERHLPAFGWEVVDDPEAADLIACHGMLWTEAPGVPVVSHCHGLYWAEYAWPHWAERANRAVTDALIKADAATAPSQWVARAIGRGLLTPVEVIYHGVDALEWQHDEPSVGYVLWNKARIDPVSDPSAVSRLAALLPDVPFVTTFGQDAANVYVTGAMPLPAMKRMVQRAGVYLATTRETFGIGTLEALASGVPVVGWRYGGQEEIIVEGETGYLVPFGDDDALADAVRRALADRERLSTNARQDAIARWGWQPRIAQYAALYDRVLAAHRAPRPRTSIVITTHNLNRYLPEAVTSARKQGESVEVIVVDDAGTEDAREVCPEAIRLPANLGLSGARNHGAQMARGEYLLFLDADDMLAPGAVRELAEALDARRDLHIAAGRLETMADDGSNRRPNPWPREIDYRQQLGHLNQLHYAALWRRRSFLATGGYRVRDWRAEDAALWCRAMSFGLRAETVTERATLYYRMRDNSKSRQEARAHADRDGDWTAQFGWRLGAESGAAGAELARSRPQLPAPLVPFGAPVPPHRTAWPVWHHQEPLVSVIIPVGPSHAPYLPDALDSLLAQTTHDWEAIVVNDTGAPLDLAPWPFARAVATAGAQGAGAARNAGLQAARGRLVCYLDADDMLLPGALRGMLTTYADGDAGYVYGDVALWRPDTHWDAPHEILAAGEYDQHVAVSHGWAEGRHGLHGVTALVETEHARAAGFDESLPGWEDWEHFLRLAVAGACGQRHPAPVIAYRLHSGQRREAAMGQKSALQSYLRDRYERYTQGESMAACCGGTRQTKAAAKAALAAPAPDAPGAVVGDGPVRMEYTGDQIGEHSIFGRPSNTIYRVGANPFNRFFNADPRDVPHLLALEHFRVVPR